MLTEWIDAVGSVIGAVAAIIVVWYAGKTLDQSNKDQRDGLERQKKQATLDAFNILQREVLDELTLTRDEVTAIAQDYHADAYKKLTTQLARIEHFCVGVNNHIYDMDTLDALAGPPYGPPVR